MGLKCVYLLLAAAHHLLGPLTGLIHIYTLHVYMSIYIYMCIYIYVYMYIYICIHCTYICI